MITTSTSRSMRFLNTILYLILLILINCFLILAQFSERIRLTRIYLGILLYPLVICVISVIAFCYLLVRYIYNFLLYVVMYINESIHYNPYLQLSAIIMFLRYQKQDRYLPIVYNSVVTSPSRCHFFCFLCLVSHHCNQFSYYKL